MGNMGSVAAKTVVQVYLEFPAIAEHPAPLLKGFVKTGIVEGGRSAVIKVVLTEKNSLRYWSNGSWVRAPHATAHIGASSADIRHTLLLDPLEAPLQTSAHLVV